MVQLGINDPLARGLTATAIYIVGGWAALFGTRVNRPSHPLPWRAIAATYVLFAINLGFWTWSLVNPSSTSAIWGMALFKLAGLAAMSVAVGSLVRVRRSTGRRDTLLDGTLIAAGGALMLWQWYMLLARRSGPTVQPAEMVPIVLVGLMLTVGLVLYRLVGGSPFASAASRYLVAGGAIAIFGQAALVLTDNGQGPSRWTDATWLVSAVLIASSALHPSMQSLTQPIRTRQGLAPRLVIAGAALLANPVLVAVQLLNGDARATSTLVIAGAAIGVVALIGLWRVGRLIVQLDNVRTTLARSERRFRSLVQRSSEVVAVLDNAGRFTYVSPASQPLLGMSPRDLAGTALIHLVVPHDREVFSNFWDQITEAPAHEARTTEVGLLSGGDETLRADIVAVNLQTDPDVSGVAVTIRDVTVRAAFEAKLRHLATHDALTGLANRELFRDRVGRALHRAKRSGKSVGVVFVDLDDFKTINDSLGHLIGDELLQVVAARLVDSLRASDTAARLGGDEFAVLLEGVADDHDAHRVVERLQQSLRRPVTIDGRSVLVGASMGLVIAGADSSPADLLRNADTAMFNAKNAGKNRTHVFEPAMHTAARSRFDMKADLSHALDRREFELYYQPIIRLSDDSIRGFEALLRWNHPTRGLVLPGEFISLVEETGQIVALGRWIMDSAIAQASVWKRSFPELGDFSMGINLSVKQFQHESIIEDIAASIEAGAVDPSNIVIEITESVFIGDTDAAVSRLESLKNLGVRLAIDDFGTGYSALGYLQQFRADIVKVDKSFVDPLGNGVTDRRLTHGILELVSGLGIDTVAEGVERPDQVIDLIAMECEYAQGFHLSIPRSSVDIEHMLDGLFRAASA